MTSSGQERRKKDFEEGKRVCTRKQENRFKKKELQEGRVKKN